MKKKSIIIFVVCLMGNSTVAFAEEKAGPSMSAMEVIDVGNAGVSVAEQADNNQAAKYIGAGTNVVAGGVFFAESNMCDNMLKCVMGGLSFGMAALSLQSGKKDNETCESVTPGDASCKPPTVTLPNNQPPGGGPGGGPGGNDPLGGNIGGTYDTEGLENLINDGLSKLKDAGYDVDLKDGSVTMPGGKKVSGGAFNNAGSMASAFGISEEEAQGILDQAAKVGKNAANGVRVSRMGLNTGGGGGGYMPRRKPSSYTSRFGSNFGNRRNRKVSGKKIVQGMTKKTTGGDLIGVKGDDVFRMMKIVYKQMRQEGYFVGPNHKFPYK